MELWLRRYIKFVSLNIAKVQYEFFQVPWVNARGTRASPEPWASGRGTPVSLVTTQANFFRTLSRRAFQVPWARERGIPGLQVRRKLRIGLAKNATNDFPVFRSDGQAGVELGIRRVDGKAVGRELRGRGGGGGERARYVEMWLSVRSGSECKRASSYVAIIT